MNTIDLKQYITDKETLNNVIDIYKQLLMNKKHYYDLLMFFKMLLKVCCEMTLDEHRKACYINPNEYFSPHIIGDRESFNMMKLKTRFHAFSHNGQYFCFNQFITKEDLKKLIIIQW
jgi:signal-transduction protein with cAMP-binding, CBS, and nucleotidyltransferase domain